MPQFNEAAPTLPTADQDRAKKFYGETLGLEIEQDTPGGTMYKLGSGHVFVYPSEFAGTNQATAATILVDDVEAAVAELRERGVTFEEYDMPGLKTVDGIAEIEGEKGAWFKDTEGNILAVAQLTG
jgi:catechol 2,3-dioxygenase-like lactoylglutathione lyase family enzyme